MSKNAGELVLFGHPFSSYCQKVLIALYENRIPFELRLLGGDERVWAELAALWPIRRMPVLVDGGRPAGDVGGGRCVAGVEPRPAALDALAGHPQRFDRHLGAGVDIAGEDVFRKFISDLKVAAEEPKDQRFLRRPSTLVRRHFAIP